MDANVRASDYQTTVFSFRSISYTFTAGNAASLAIIVFGDLTSQAQLALAAFVVMLNLASALSFDNSLRAMSVLAKEMGWKGPFGFYRIFCLVVCIVAAVTQLLAIYA
jgi:hypothetical protein